jgi:hypothetical protein
MRVAVVAFMPDPACPVLAGHTVIAFGTLYFCVLACSKAHDVRLPQRHLPGMNAARP